MVLLGRLAHALAVVGALMAMLAGCTSADPADTVTEPVQVDDSGEEPELQIPEAGDAAYCAENQWLAACGPVLEDLSDAEFCDLLPDDLFCERFFDPDADTRDATAEPRATPVESAGAVDDGGTADAGPIRVVPPSGDDDDDTMVVAIDPLLRRDDGMCLPADRLQVEGDIDYDVAYQVVDGQLGNVCHGIPDGQIEVAWRILSELSPPEYLTELAVFAGFFDNRNNGRRAFVRPVGDRRAPEFLMGINLVSLDDDEYTVFAMAHEMSHVLTQRTGQLDPTISPADCPTIHSGNGCHLRGSILERWAAEFWTAERPADIEERCEEDAGLLTSYAATNPHEDFAESFAAAVVGFRPENGGHDDRFAFIAADPVLRQFVARGQTQGYESPRFILGVCG